MGGEINVNTAMDQVTITGSVLSEFAGDLIAIMSDVVMNPAFPASEIDRLKSDLKRQLAVQKQQPSQQASENSVRLFIRIMPTVAISLPKKCWTATPLRWWKNLFENFGAKRSGDLRGRKIWWSQSFSRYRQGVHQLGCRSRGELSTNTKKTNEVAQIDRKGAPQTTVIVGLPTLTPKDQDFVALQSNEHLVGWRLVRASRATFAKTKVHILTVQHHSKSQRRFRCVWTSWCNDRTHRRFTNRDCKRN